MATSTLTFVIVGQEDHPIYEVDLTGPKEVRGLGEGAVARPRTSPLKPRPAHVSPRALC